jgi:hypothetical protein
MLKLLDGAVSLETHPHGKPVAFGPARAWKRAYDPMKPRENRQKVMIKARMLNGAAWQDICILNCSPHGLGIQSPMAPQRGSYVEIRRGRQTIVARVAWSKGHRAGLRSQDPIFIGALASGIDSAPAPSKADFTERRRQPRPPAPSYSDSRLAGRAMEFACFAVIAAAVGLAGLSAVSEALARPMQEVNATLQ